MTETISPIPRVLGRIEEMKQMVRGRLFHAGVPTDDEAAFDALCAYYEGVIAGLTETIKRGGCDKDL